jgi:hypothetical protein
LEPEPSDSISFAELRGDQLSFMTLNPTAMTCIKTPCSSNACIVNVPTTIFVNAPFNPPCSDPYRGNWNSSTGWEMRTLNPSPYKVQPNGCTTPVFRGHFLIWDFTPACNVHDTCYGTCGTVRKTCDDNFLKAMKKICGKLPDRSRVECFRVAESYYLAVRIVSNFLFENEQNKACKWIECDPISSTTFPGT